MKTPPRHPNPPDLEAAAVAAQQLMETLRRGQPWPLQSRAEAHWSLRRRIAQASLSRRGAPRAPVLRTTALGGLLAAAAALLWFGVLGPELLPEAPAPLDVEAALRPAHDITTADPAAAGAGEAWPDSAEIGAEAWTQVNFPDLGSLELAMDEGFEVRELPTERQLRIGSGVLRAQIVHQDPERPAVVVTPHLRVVVVGTRFDVTATESLTRVEVIEGKVRVESRSGGSVLLTGGMSIRSDDARLRLAGTRSTAASAVAPAASEPPQVTGSSGAAAFPAPSVAFVTRPRHRASVRAAAAAPEVECERLASLDAQERCLEQLTAGDDLAAQNALFALAVFVRDVEGAPERAAALFGEYGQRFPTGPLAPEAALGRLEVFGSLGRAEEAIASALEFERRFAADARVSEVVVVRAQLECRDPARRSEALKLLDRLAARPRARLRDAALRAREECLAGSGASPPPSAEDSPPKNAAGPPPD